MGCQDFDFSCLNLFHRQAIAPYLERKIMILEQYLLGALLTFVPASQHAYYESEEATLDRYSSIAHTIAVISKEQPLFADDEDGVKTGLILASIASSESNLREDVDDCRRGGDRDKHGNWLAWGLWQTHAPKSEVCSSRLSGARIAREMVRTSFSVCSSFAWSDRLSVYTDGVCKNNWKRSSFRLNRAVQYLKQHTFSTSNI